MNFSRMIFTSPHLCLILVCSLVCSVLVYPDRETKTGYRREDFLKLTLNLVPGNNTGNPTEPMSYNNAYKKVKNYLGNMLQGLLQRIQDHPGSGNALLITLGPTASVSELKRQLDAYWKHEYPFDTSTTFRAEKHSLEWWRSLERHNHA